MTRGVKRRSDYVQVKPSDQMQDPRKIIIF